MSDAELEPAQISVGPVVSEEGAVMPFMPLMPLPELKISFIRLKLTFGTTLLMIVAKARAPRAA